jgi:hypothetical protein
LTVRSYSLVEPPANFGTGCGSERFRTGSVDAFELDWASLDLAFERTQGGRGHVGEI